MTMYAIEAQRFGLKKEGTRGVAESAPDKWYPTRGRAELNYSTELLKDAGIRGTFSELPPVAGKKSGEGKIPLYADAQMIGEFLYSLLGGVTPDQQEATAAYKHTFLRTGIQPQSYTFFLDRSLNVLKYNLGCVKKLTFKSSVDGLMEVDADVLFKSEAAGSIGSPSFPTQQYLGFNTVAFKIAGTTDTEVKDWELSIDNGAVGHRTLAASQDITEVYAPAKLAIEGGFTIYFANTTERAKFLANTGVAIRMLCEGAVCSTPYKYTIDLNIYDAHYTAFPYGEDQGLLAAQAKFTGHYSTGDAKALQIDVTNLVTAY